MRRDALHSVGITNKTGKGPKTFGLFLFLNFFAFDTDEMKCYNKIKL